MRRAHLFFYLLFFISPVSPTDDYHTVNMGYAEEASFVEQFLVKIVGPAAPAIFCAVKFVVPWFFSKNSAEESNNACIQPKTDRHHDINETTDAVGLDEDDYPPLRKITYPQQPHGPAPKPPKKPPHDNSNNICQQQRITAQKNFSTQRPWLDENISYVCSGSPERWGAYQEGKKGNWSRSLKKYELSDKASAKLQEQGYGADKFTTHYGNALQQQLHGEAVDGVEAVTIIDGYVTDYCGEVLCGESLRLFDGACQANTMGDARSTACLIDLGKALLRFQFGRMRSDDMALICDASVSFCKGFLKRIPETLHSFGHMIAHPIETAQNMGLALVQIGATLHNYIPPEPRYFAEDYESYSQKCEEAAENWRNLHKALLKTWHETPASVACKAAGGFAADCIVSHCCCSVAGKACSLAAAEVSTGAARLSSELAMLDVAAPGYLLINSVQETEILCQTAQLYAMSEPILHNGLQALEVLNPGCTHKLTKLLQETSHVPGIAEQIISTIEQASHGTGLAQAVRSSEKLEHALNLILSGEELCGYGSSIIEGSSTLFDYATESKAIKFIDQSVPSLKNIKPFESSRNAPLLNFQQNILRKKELAYQAGKAFEVHFSGIIEREWAEWLAQEQIAYDFAHKIKLDNFLKRIISQEEWAELYEYAKKFTIIDPVSGQLIRPEINLEHIFLPEVKWRSNGKCKISGFHHDYIGVLEVEELISMQRSQAFAYGCYETEIFYVNDGKFSTCFSQEVGRKKIIENIFEAFGDNERVVERSRVGSNLRIRGKTHDGMVIEGFFDPAEQKIVTAYPQKKQFLKD